jgi:two-component system, NtrC family, sensor histidine kinase HydH
MNPGRPRGALSLSTILSVILAGTIILSLLFFTFWQRLNRKVEGILKSQFNQQQLELARKIADNVEAYFDFLESDLLAYPWRFQLVPPGSAAFDKYMQARCQKLRNLGVLEIRWYDANGRLTRVWCDQHAATSPEAQASLPPSVLAWVHNPQSKGRLYLGMVHRDTQPPLQGRLVMPFLTGIYATPEATAPYGVLELVINPLYIAGKVTEGVHSGKTGYAWIVDQDGILLAHYEKAFVGQNALEVRHERSPNIVFTGLKELQDKLLKGEEGTGGYVSGWHRRRVGRTPKLAAYTPIHFDRGLIRGVTDVEDPAHNLWGVAVVAPVAEVGGQVSEVSRQELFLVALFSLAIILGAVSLIVVALSWNKSLAREVHLKTEELLASQERLVRSERFAAIGEAAAYVSHEIKNPLMVIGGLAHQVENKEGEPTLKEKLHIIQSEVQRLETFLGDLRDFTRPATPVMQETNLNEVIHDVDTLMKEEAKNRGINLVEQLDPQLPTLTADPNQMRQVLLNLMKNAFEAMDSGGRVIIASGAEDNQVWFSVEDTGNGMPPEVLEKVFNPFFTTKKKGTGLGLAVIHKIIADHHGAVNVRSLPDQGTTFRILLPVAS